MLLKEASSSSQTTAHPVYWPSFFRHTIHVQRTASITCKLSALAVKREETVSVRRGRENEREKTVLYSTAVISAENRGPALRRTHTHTHTHTHWSAIRDMLKHIHTHKCTCTIILLDNIYRSESLHVACVIFDILAN